VFGPIQSGPARHVFPFPSVISVWLLAAGCVAPGDSLAAEPETLRVAAASDLRDAMPVLAKRFTETSGVKVIPTFGASGQLAEQIKAGAPFDLFLAANIRFVQDLASIGLIQPESLKPYAQGTLVLAVHRESKGAIETLADLKRPEVRKIALANPVTAPYGAAGKQALERARLWEDLKPKIVTADSVRQAYHYVQTGNTEAGLVSQSIVGVPEVRVIAVDPELYDPIIQGMGIVTRPGSRKVEAFHAFILGPEGRKILSDYGLKPP
jgi:molybdate transport system substrate-binding protein